MSEFVYILLPTEAEAYVESLTALNYEEYGKESWYRQHAYLDKLNLQSVVSAKSGGDEYIKEFIVNHQKVPILIQNLMAIELWQRHVFKRIVRRYSDVETSNIPSFPIYVITYQQLVLANLLETIAYHVDIIGGLSDFAVDLCDWSHRALCRLVSQTSTDDQKATMRSLKERIQTETEAEELKRQARVISFEVSMKAISLSRHLIEHSCSSIRAVSESALPLGVARRLLQTHDFLIFFCQLIELAPWTCEDFEPTSGRRTRFQWHESGVWISETDEKNWVILTRTEGQIWLGIYQILFSDIIRSVNYDLTLNHRNQALLRLRPHITEALIDVIPVLGELRRFLDQFSVAESATLAAYQCAEGKASSASAVANLCQVELVAEVYEGLCRSNKGKWDEIAEGFIERIQTPSGREAAKRAAAKWSEVYSEDNVDTVFRGARGDGVVDSFEHPLLPPPRCVACGELATKRCSRCRQEWYCRRECQVNHWPRHKTACDMMISTTVEQHQETALH